MLELARERESERVRERARGPVLCCCRLALRRSVCVLLSVYHCTAGSCAEFVADPPQYHQRFLPTEPSFSPQRVVSFQIWNNLTVTWSDFIIILLFFGKKKRERSQTTGEGGFIPTSIYFFLTKEVPVDLFGLNLLIHGFTRAHEGKWPYFYSPWSAMLTISPEPCIQAFTPFFPSPLLFFFFSTPRPSGYFSCSRGPRPQATQTGALGSDNSVLRLVCDVSVLTPDFVRNNIVVQWLQPTTDWQL